MKLLIFLLVLLIICILLSNDNVAIYKTIVTQEERKKKEMFNSLIDGISSIPIPSTLSPDNPTFLGGSLGSSIRRSNHDLNLKDTSLVLYLDAKKYAGGSVWNDLSGKRNDFTLPSGGVSWNPDGFFKVDAAVGADGPSSDKFNITTDHTVIIVANTTTNTCNSVLNLQAPDTTRMLNIHLPWCDGNVYYDVRSCCDGSNRVYYKPTNPWNNTKHMVFRTRTNVFPNREIFENGKSMISSGNNTTSVQNQWGGRSYLWNYQHSGLPWVGDFYMIMIYNRALSDGEIQQNLKFCNNYYNFNNENPQNDSALMLYSINDTDIDNMMRLGATYKNPAINALQILEKNGPSPDGVYWILCNNQPKPVYCLMDPKYNGGGWMLLMKMAQGGATFSFNSPHWTQKTSLNDDDLNLDCQDAKFDAFNNVQIKDVMAIFPKDSGINTFGGCIPTIDWGYTWLVNNWWKNGGKTTGLIGFNTPRDANPASPDDFCGFNTKIFSEQSPARRHVFGGHSHLSTGTWGGGRNNWVTPRWGFVWNENGQNDFESNDAAGGIGLGNFGEGERANMSAGDFFGCCGISRFNGSFGALLFGR